jgi:hypothetical protein
MLPTRPAPNPARVFTLHGNYALREFSCVRLPEWALHTLGFKDEQTTHSFRTLASTRLNSMGFPPDVIELQLSHQEADESRGAYNRADRMPERRQMMQIWADVLDQSIRLQVALAGRSPQDSRALQGARRQKRAECTG